MIGYCKICGSTFKGNKNKMYCRKACKQEAYRRRNGIKAPFNKAPRNIYQPAIRAIQQVAKAPQIGSLAANALQSVATKQVANFEPIESSSPIPLIAMSSFIAASGCQKNKGFCLIVGGLVGYGLHKILSSIFSRNDEEYIEAEVIQAPQIRQITQAIQAPKVNNQTAISSAQSYASYYVKSLEFDDKWMYLIGKPQADFFMIVHGLPGNGKTTLAADFANYFHRSKFGKVLYLAAEQKGHSTAFQDTLKRINGKFDVHTNAHKLDLSDIKQLKGYDLIVFDSVNYMKLEAHEMEEVKESLGCAVLAIMQSTKDGNFKGSNDWAHDADIIIRCENMIAYQTKSRYAAPSHVKI